MQNTIQINFFIKKNFFFSKFALKVGNQIKFAKTKRIMIPSISCIFFHAYLKII